MAQEFIGMTALTSASACKEEMQPCFEIMLAVGIGGDMRQWKRHC